MKSNRLPPIATISDSKQNLVEISTNGRILQRIQNKWFKFLLPPAILLLIIFFILFLVFYVKYRNAIGALCSTKDCIETAEALLQTMDPTKDPCSDFYAYACGNFDQLHPIPEDQSHYSWFLDGEEKLIRMIETVLEQPSRIRDKRYLSTAKAFYHSCVNSDETHKLGLKPLYEVLEMNGLPRFPTEEAAETFSLGRTLGLLQRNLNEDIIIQVSIAKGALRNGESNDTHILEIGPSFVMRGIAGVIAEQEEGPSVLTAQQILFQRINFMSEVLKIVKLDIDGTVPDNNSSQFTKDAVKILKFSSSLLEVIRIKANQSEVVADDMTFEALQKALEVYSGGQGGNSISWAVYLDHLLDDAHKFVNYDYSVDNVRVTDLDILKEIFTFLGNSKPISILRYIWWIVVNEYARHTTREMNAVYHSLFMKLTGRSAFPSTRKFCASYSRKIMPLAMIATVKETFKLAENIKKVEEMMSDIKYEFQGMVSALKWMDSHTKDINLEKADAVQSYIGYDEKSLDPSYVEHVYHRLLMRPKQFLKNLVSYKQWQFSQLIEILKREGNTQEVKSITNPLQVNAFYSRGHNAIYIPAGILQRPFYYRGLEYLNYGAIGTILGHELTHGFDIDGKNFDINGKIQDDLWPHDVTVQYIDRAQCFVNQYGTYNLTKTRRLNGKYTLAENIADNGGLREAFFAYQTYVKRNGAEPKLVGFEDFSQEQLLFLSYANIWCEAATEQSQTMALADTHSPNRIRVLATLQNMEEFSEAYNCPKSSFMNPEEKCVIW